MPAHTCAAVSCPARTAHRGRQRAAAAAVTRAPGSPPGRGAARQPSTVGVRSVSTTNPACRVDDAASSPARYPGPPITTTCRCGRTAADPSPATISVVPAGSRAVTAASAASAARTAPARAPPGPPGSDPRSTTVSGHRASTARLSPEIPGRYEPTAPPGPASASAAPGPTAVAQPPRPAADASSPHRGLYFSVRLYATSDGIAATRAGPGTPTRPGTPTTPDPEVTTGTAGHKPPLPRGACARSPPFSVSHASAGHVRGPTAKSTSDPGEPARATAHNAGVADAETSLQRSPEIPTMTTCAETAAAGWPAARAGPEPTPLRTATRAAPTARRPNSIRRASVPFTGSGYR